MCTLNLNKTKTNVRVGFRFAADGSASFFLHHVCLEADSVGDTVETHVLDHGIPNLGVAIALQASEEKHHRVRFKAKKGPMSECHRPRP